MKKDVFKVNSKEYKIFASKGRVTKKSYENCSFKVELFVEIMPTSENNYLTGSEVTEYMKEKFSDLVVNSANGYRTFNK